MTRAITNASTRARRGGMFVEAALVISVVIFTLIGIVDIGQVLVLHQGLTERVRAGARWAVVNPYNVTGIKNVVLYNNPSPTGTPKPLLGLTATMVTVTQTGAGTPEARIEVRIVNYPFRFFNPLIKGLYTAKPIFVTMPMEGMGATT
jgi:hypothetical protein